MLKGFKDFIMRGNVLDLAVGIIIGAAFGSIVNSLVKDVITPAIGAIGGQPDFGAIKIGPVLIGNFVNAVVSFLLIAAALYFFVVLPVTRLSKKKEETPPSPSKSEAYLKEIRDLLAARKA
ncbi:MAG TPA: large conductance mechanosensitive channel protein MscL [Thermoanaerobaculia bacterium]|jgi:large conductance mechanosensitive channel